MAFLLGCGRASCRLEASRIKTSCRNRVHPLQAPSDPHCLLLQNQRQHLGRLPKEGKVHAPALQMKTESVCTGLPPLEAPSHPHCLPLQNQRQHPWGDSPEVHAPALQMKQESACTVWFTYIFKTVC